MNGCVVLYGNDPQLLSIRAQVLEQSGFRLTLISRLEELSGLFPRSRVDLVILCHSLTPAETRDAFIVSRRLWPEVQVLALTGAGETDGKPVGECLNVYAGPQALVDASRALSRTSE